MWLTREVAASVDVDLSVAMQAGQLNPRSYSDLLTRCRGAGCDRACALHLSALKNGRQDKVQEFCPNKEQLDQLASKPRRAPNPA